MATLIAISKSPSRVVRTAVDRIAREERISASAIRARAYGDMTPGSAYRAGSAFATCARIAATVVDAGLIGGALGIRETFAALAGRQGISNVSLRAGTNGPLLSGIIVTRSTYRVHATRVWFAKIRWRKWSAPDKRISRHVARTAANGSNVAKFTVGVDAANSVAWVQTFLIEAGRFASRTVRMMRTFRATGRQRITLPVIRTGAHRAMSYDLAVGILAAFARAFAFECCAAGQMIRTVAVALALVTATDQRRTPITRQARAHRNVVDNLAARILSARTRFARGLRIGMAEREGISGIIRRTRTRRHVISGLTDRVGTAKSCARVDAPIIHACFASYAILVDQALDANALS